jgi:transposase
MDLRERLVAAYLAGGTTQQRVAERFGVSQWAVHKLCRQHRELGHLHTRYPRQRPGWKITVVKQERIARLLAERADVTLAEIKRRLRLNCSLSAISYALRRLGYTRKKRLYVPRNSSVRTLPANARSGRHGGRNGRPGG